MGFSQGFSQSFSKIKRYILWLMLGLSLTVFSCQQTVSQAAPPVNVTLLSAPLIPLTQPGPWGEVSHLISYQHRLWFANSRVFGDHNSADIYSYDPSDGDTRFEQHLFSQSTGDPAVAKGLLYWPFEDPRFSADRGEYMVTNGNQWQWHLLPEGEVFHVHAMAHHDGALWASTGAWSGGVQRSTDGGKTWKLMYTYPTPERRVSRVTNLVSLGDWLLAEIMAVHEPGSKVLKSQGNTFEPIFQPIESWPNGKRIHALTAFQDRVYGVNQNPDDSYSVWRTDSEQAEAVTGLDGHRIRDFAATDDTLWAVSSGPSAQQGYLWRSNDGLDWAAVQHFTDMRPLAVAVHEGQVYVGGRSTNGNGVLWGPTTHQVLSIRQPEKPHNISLPQQVLSPLNVQQQLSALDAILSSPETYTAGNAQDVLAKTLMPLALERTPAVSEQLAAYLQQPLPAKSAQLFGGNASAPATHVVQWYLLWAMGLNGYGQVPLELLQTPWTEPANDREKYWHPAPAAAWAVAQLGQDDRATIGAIMERLTTQTDPLWLVGDFVGALHTLTGEQFGYDVAAWQQWWETL